MNSMHPGSIETELSRSLSTDPSPEAADCARRMELPEVIHPEHPHLAVRTVHGARRDPLLRIRGRRPEQAA
ncbi:hypothetical protein [Streptomyces sp. Ncost-T10-10d]|uniref:hypothetical protein n=1 Tax=Streptomyces sp. Ncost-T10-10d TaxID=1839774 RepID=UPI00081E7E1A|nr:hypothetical protein [Streptomyces sp. Ncost-T10-10d]SCF70862.1 hypothetical protein GA0115254_112449 [Streptomyces sp. Ncost-T10-10d]